MTLYDRAEFEQYILTFTGGTLHNQWEACVAKVGPKFFAALGNPKGSWRNKLIFKANQASYEMMIMQEGIRRAPYMRGTWLAVDNGSLLSDDDLRLYIAQSYKIVAKSLTRQIRADLGIVL